MGERVTSGGPILLDGLAYGIDPLDAILVVHATDGRLYASWTSAGAGFGAEEAAESLWLMYRATQAFAGKLAVSTRSEGREPSRLFLTLEFASRVVMVQRARAYAVACFFEASMPLGMARLVASRITDALEPDLPLAILLPSVATTAAATTDSLVPPTEDPPPPSRVPISRPISTKPAPTEPGATLEATRPVMPTLASLAAARSDSAAGLDRIIVSGAPEHALQSAPRPRSEGPPKTLSFPSLGAALIRPASTPPSVRATPAEVERVKRILQHLEENAPDPHIAHLRVALRAGLTPLALANVEALPPSALALIETAVEEILGADLSALGVTS